MIACTLDSHSPPKYPKGWPALLGGGLVNIAFGTYYMWSVFVPALEHEFGWSRPQTSLVSTIDMVMLASMFTVAGMFQNRLGVRTVATIGGMLFSLGMLLASFVHSLPMLYLTSGLMVGTGLGFGFLAPITVGSKWFPNHRGLVNGFAIAVFGAGSGIFGPFAGLLIERVGWRETFQILAGIFLVLTMTGAYLLKDPPPGYVGPPGKATGKGRPRPSSRDVPTSRVLRDPVFIALWIAHALGTTAGTMVISQLVPFARLSGLNARTAAFAITVGAIGSASGRLFSGWMSDHFGRLPALRTVIAISMMVTPMLYLWRGDVLVFYPLLCAVYYCYGTQISVYASLVGDFWGLKYMPTNYGVLLLAWGCAGVGGPYIGSHVFQSTGSYRDAFFGAAGLACVALIILALVRIPQTSPIAPDAVGAQATRL